MPWQSFTAILNRDLRLALRRFSEWANPLIFYLAVSAMFPLALAPDRFGIGSAAGGDAYALQSLGIGVLWMAALLSALLSLDRLFLGDHEDGSLEQLILSPAPFLSIVYGKLVAHWLISAVPLIALLPIVGLFYELPGNALAMQALALLLATPTLIVLVAIGAALTVTVRNAAVIVGLLVLPLSSPILVFGARATVLSLDAEPAAGPLYLLASLACLAVSLGPLAIAAALKVAVE